MRKTARVDGKNVELISRYLSSERGAVEAYRAAMSTPTQKLALDAGLRSHLKRVELLEAELVRLGASTDVPVTPWKKMSAAIVRMAASIHPGAAVQLLVQGEVNGVAFYRDEMKAASPRVRTLIERELINEQQQCVEAMTQLESSFAVPLAA